MTKKDLKKALQNHECVMVTFGQVHPENNQCANDFYHLIFRDDATRAKRIAELDNIDFGSYSSDYGDYIMTFTEWDSVWSGRDYFFLGREADKAMEDAGQYARDYRGYAGGEVLPDWMTQI